MYQHSYAEVFADSAVDSRDLERRALDHAVTLLDQAAAQRPGSPAEDEALEFTTQLWSSFIKDLADDGNALPDVLRANLMSIGLGVMAEVGRIRAGTSRDLSAVSEICAIVRDGLV